MKPVLSISSRSPEARAVEPRLWLVTKSYTIMTTPSFSGIAQAIMPTVH
jgi:hypothetical protein